MRIGIIAALPGELKPLVANWARMPVAKGSGIAMWKREHGGDEYVAVCAGMGAAAARRAFSAAEFAGSLDVVMSVGWAGALTDTTIGLEMGEVIDAQTGERFRAGTTSMQRVVTTVRVAGAMEKQRLAASYGAVAVDMEAATVARLAQMRGIAFFCFKAVSDGLDARLPDINPFIYIDGTMKMSRFLAHVAVRPQFWGSLLEMGSRSAKGAKELALVVEAFLSAERA